jgi:hypothetical protein
VTVCRSDCLVRARPEDFRTGDRAAVTSVGWTFEGIAELGDLRQEAAIFVASNPAKVRECLGDPRTPAFPASGCGRGYGLDATSSTQRQQDDPDPAAGGVAPFRRRP